MSRRTQRKGTLTDCSVTRVVRTAISMRFDHVRKWLPKLFGLVAVSKKGRGGSDLCKDKVCYTEAPSKLSRNPFRGGTPYFVTPIETPVAWGFEGWNSYSQKSNHGTRGYFYNKKVSELIMIRTSHLSALADRFPDRLFEIPALFVFDVELEPGVYPVAHRATVFAPFAARVIFDPSQFRKRFEGQALILEDLLKRGVFHWDTFCFLRIIPVNCIKS